MAEEPAIVRRTALLIALLALLPAASALAEQPVELQGLLASLGATCEWNPLGSSGVILLGDDRVAFQVGTPFVLVDWEERVMIDPPERRDGGVWFTPAAVAAVRGAVQQIRERQPEPGQRIAAIMLDPGHGGKDPGGTGELVVDGRKVPLLEKDVVLKIAGFLAEKLHAAFPGKEVRCMRTSDVEVKLEDRPKVANKLLAEVDGSVLYVSIHANKSFNTKATGYEVWRLPPTYRRTVLDAASVPNSDAEALPVLNNMLEADIQQQSVLLGQEILRGLDSSIGSLSPNRGLKEEEWVVVRSSKMPAVLVEVGYVSNPAEGARLADDAYLRRIAEGLYAGIRSFVARFERSGAGGSGGQ
jgi:N-acetylmuramoyl-L-alanine amidase